MDARKFTTTELEDFVRVARLASVARTAVLALGDRVQELTSLLAAERRRR